MTVRCCLVSITIAALCAPALASSETTIHETKTSLPMLRFDARPLTARPLFLAVKRHGSQRAAQFIDAAAQGGTNDFVHFLVAHGTQAPGWHLTVPLHSKQLNGLTSFIATQGVSHVALLFGLFGRLESEIGRTGSHVAARVIGEHFKPAFDKAAADLQGNGILPASINLDDRARAIAQLQQCWLHGEALNSAAQRQPAGILGLLLGGL